MTTLLHRTLRSIAILGSALALVALVVLTVAWHALQAKPDEWARVVHVGPWSQRLSMPVLLRWATHPLVLPLLDERTLRTSAGTWRLRTSSSGDVHAACAPCTMRLGALGPAPLRLNAVQVDAQRVGPESWKATITLGDDAAAPITMSVHAQLTADGVKLRAVTPPAPVSAMVNVFAADVPEAAHARIFGSFGLEAHATVDAKGLSLTRVRPRLHDVSVHGLGTEALLDAQPRSRCALSHSPGAPASNATAQGSDAPRIGGWLPRAVLAAEDQRFFEHAGFDLQEVLASWTRNQGREHRPRGASTLTQQLAKIVYVGDERSAARKLREWLYAVEMERTLGKGRILQLYLALAPWGKEVCGADAAARRYLGKPASRLAPHEAAWLASLLSQPQAQLHGLQSGHAFDPARAARVAEALRPMPKARRDEVVELLRQWEPDRQRLRAIANDLPTPHQAAGVTVPSL